MKALIFPFSVDVTPPKGHPLCGGWITPARSVLDPLEARGFVFAGNEAPWVFCEFDWVGIRNRAHLALQTALAEAARTTPERVWIHCVHPHDAPFTDVGAQGYLDSVHGPASMDLGFFDLVVSRLSETVKKALTKGREVDRMAYGKAKVEAVASARRVLGSNGLVKFTRTSFTKDAAAREAPEGLIDPYLRMLSFLQGNQPIVTVHTYATHPMSRYGEGKVSADFTALARRNWEQKQGGFVIYATGCAGNITAGKYNDGTPESKIRLASQLEKAMDESWEKRTEIPLEMPIFRHCPIPFAARREPEFSTEQSWKVLENKKAAPSARGNAAYQLAWLDRVSRPVHTAALDFGKVLWISLPGEPFIEYQLFAQELAGDRFTIVSGYGDDGPGYIPIDSAFAQGGYEPTVALAAPSEALMKKTLAKLAGR